MGLSYQYQFGFKVKEKKEFHERFGNKTLAIGNGICQFEPENVFSLFSSHNPKKNFFVKSENFAAKITLFASRYFNSIVKVLSIAEPLTQFSACSVMKVTLMSSMYIRRKQSILHLFSTTLSFLFCVAHSHCFV